MLIKQLVKKPKLGLTFIHTLPIEIFAVSSLKQVVENFTFNILRAHKAKETPGRSSKMKLATELMYQTTKLKGNPPCEMKPKCLKSGSFPI